MQRPSLVSWQEHLMYNSSSSSYPPNTVLKVKLILVWLRDRTLTSLRGRSASSTRARSPIEKIYPDYPTLAMALGVYLAIRALYDTDNLGFGCAIGLYMRQLALWSKHHNWAAIMAYFVAHFRKHQPSPDPRVWMDVDVQLFTMYVTIDTLKSPRVPVTAATTTEVCNKWNSDKGCHWSRCLRKHICSLCKGDHTALHCSSRTPASKQS